MYAMRKDGWRIILFVWWIVSNNSFSKHVGDGCDFYFRADYSCKKKKSTRKK
jgi:hypothetical protein